MHLDFNQGFAKVLGGCETKVLAENDHGGSRIFGEVKAGFIELDELVLDESLETPVSRLQALLVPELAGEVEELLGNRELGAFLGGRLIDGAPVFAG